MPTNRNPPADQVTSEPDAGAVEPCRWCESKAVRASFVRISDEHQWHHVECGNCFAVGPHRATSSEAIAAWNTRTATVARVEPDIGGDPMKGPREQYRGEPAIARLRQAYVIQQKEVRDQTALVWRCDLGFVLMELTRLYAWQKDEALSTLSPASVGAGEPVAWVSPGQLAAHKPGPDDNRYLPVVKERGGNFTMPLYASPATPTEQAEQGGEEKRKSYLLKKAAKVARGEA